ncbi:MAG: hypothetical protein NTZ05_09730 [Chloroflexi bacterium]|nr:hypothetical protein [Chloroflexota bacterium]
MPFESLTENITPRLRERGFTPLDEGGGVRYDSWEWNWVRHIDGGVEFITLAALETQPGIYDIEVWADGIEQGHIDRMLLLQFHAIRESDTVKDDERHAVIEIALVDVAEWFMRFPRNDCPLLKPNTPRRVTP